MVNLPLLRNLVRSSTSQRWFASHEHYFFHQCRWELPFPDGKPAIAKHRAQCRPVSSCAFGMRARYVSTVNGGSTFSTLISAACASSIRPCDTSAMVNARHVEGCKRLRVSE